MIVSVTFIQKWAWLLGLVQMLMDEWTGRKQDPKQTVSIHLKREKLTI